jgi:CheY-like chemotaxis protein
MSKEYLPTLFEPFSQDSEHDKATYRGTGLGMAIVKHYVDMMGGEIRVDSVQGKGTRFVMELGFEIDENPTEDKTEVHSNFRLDGEKILIAEDNELNAEITAEILKKTGAEIVIATNGKNAVDIYSHSKKDDFDLILMDVRMPEEDGIAAAKEIRHLNRSDAADIPIIAITANTLDEDRSSAIDAGMNAYLSKPIDANSLFKTLKKVL